MFSWGGANFRLIVFVFLGWGRLQIDRFCFLGVGQAFVFFLTFFIFLTSYTCLVWGSGGEDVCFWNFAAYVARPLVFCHLLQHQSMSLSLSFLPSVPCELALASSGLFSISLSFLRLKVVPPTRLYTEEKCGCFLAQGVHLLS